MIEGSFFRHKLSVYKNFQLSAFLILFHGVLWSSLFQEVFFRGYIFQTMLTQWGNLEGAARNGGHF
jgi:membrane protease YdiL (CAAX protease family)